MISSTRSAVRTALVLVLVPIAACSRGSATTDRPTDPADTGMERPTPAHAPACTPAMPSPELGPLPGVVALAFREPGDIPARLRSLTAQYAKGTLPDGAGFPLANSVSPGVRVIDGFRTSVVARQFDPLTCDDGPTAPRLGANPDYLAYFGAGWNAVPGDPPQWHGSATDGWMWVNHEHVAGEMPEATNAPTKQHLTLARHLARHGLLAGSPESDTWSEPDLLTYVRRYKRELGGSWMRVTQDEATGVWSVDRRAANLRYDGSSDTRLLLTGHSLVSPEHDDAGGALPEGVVPGVMGDCAGGVTPWGTVITAEENVQDYYGDLEAAWTSDQKFVAGNGFDPGHVVSPVLGASPASHWGRASAPGERHARDGYGYLTEIDPGVAPIEHLGATRPGRGHAKLGAFGRAHWENATFAVGADWKLRAGQPIVAYAGDDRRGGRVYKFVTNGVWSPGMSRAEISALLADAEIYVAHFEGLDDSTGNTMLATGKAPTQAAPGRGRWLHLSVDSADLAPNAAALGEPSRTIGSALTSATWNGIGGFPTDAHIRRSLFTASNKIGVMELNRSEDVEWNPVGTPRLYISFSNHEGKVALDQDGVLIPPARHATDAPERQDSEGAIVAVEEDDPNPALSRTFDYFAVWQGHEGTGLFDATSPDNLLIDPSGGVWFGTDGNFRTNGTAEALYYLDLDPTHAAGQPGVVEPTFGRAFRIAAVPDDAEATGPAFTSDMRTLFLSVQHPGETMPSTWPWNE